MDLNKGVSTFLHSVKTDLEMFLEIQPVYVPLECPCLDFFFPDFSDFYLRGDLWGKSFISNT